MRRDLAQLTDRTHDLLVVGGGIHGACVAWDAALRGLSVALIDRDDFGAAASANNLRIAHGGLRYLARGDIRRMRRSIRERSRLMAIAPELVVPLPVVVPTHGAGAESRLAMRLALALNDLGSLDRNRGLDPAHRLPRSRTLSRAEALRLFPHFGSRGLTGAAMWYDARVRSPERLTLAFIRSAAARGAAAANYVAAERFLVTAGEVRGIEAIDRRSGRSLEIRARAVLVTAGAWTDRLVALASGRAAARRPAPVTHAFALNLMVGRRLAPVAVGIRASSGPADDPVIGGNRYIFLAPQEESTLLGTWYALDDGTESHEAAARGAEALRAEFNAACPGLGLTAADVSRAQFGRMPVKAGIEPGRATALADRPRVRDHATEGLGHLFSVEGVKYTTAREVAEDAVDRVVCHLGVQAAPCRTTVTPLVGAHYVAADHPGLESRLRSAVRDEMAVTLSDVVFRRTALAEPPGPRREAVTDAARIVGEELGWEASTRLAEIEEVMRQAEGPTAAPRMATA